MAILNRLVKLCKADIHGVMDQLEDPELLLKQHLRDMDESLYKKEDRLKKMMLLRDQVHKEYDRCQKETQELEQDLEVAILKNRDDIARMLIRKLKPLENIQKQRQAHMESVELDIDGFTRVLDQQRLQNEQLKQKANTYFQKAEQDAWYASMSRVMSDHRSPDVSEEEIELELLRRKETLKGGDES